MTGKLKWVKPEYFAFSADRGTACGRAAVGRKRDGRVRPSC